MFKKGEKDKYEEEEEEVERNVRESPKDKPPRRDKERRTIEEDDPDIDEDPDVSDDKDLSMNYKDIGGSVASRYYRNVVAQEDEENEDGGDGDVPFADEGDEENQDQEEEEDEGASDESSNELDKDYLEELLTYDDESDQDQLEKVVEHALTGPETDLSKPVDELAKDWYNHTSEELASVILSKEAEEKEKSAAKRAIHLKKAPLPPNWSPKETFDSGVITLKARKRLRNHMDNWTEEDFKRNLDKIKRKSIAESITDGSDIKDDYYSALEDIVQEEKEKVLSQGGDPVDSISDLIPDEVEKAEEIEFKEDHREALKKRVNNWRKRLRKTGEEKIENLADEVKETLDEIDNQLSVKQAYYSVLWNVLKGALVMKKAKKVASRYTKKAEYRGLPGPLPEDEQPPQPKWRKPDPLDLDIQDYMRILDEAESWLDKGILNPLVEHDMNMACRMALDYAIFDLKEGIYDGTVDVPVYNDLLDLLLQRVQE